MGLSHSPKIVKDGLILYLDAANRKSYPGTGTTWYDLTGNGHNGTLINSPTFSTANQGVFVFDGTDDYIQITSLDLRFGQYTIFGASRYITEGGRTISSLNNNWLMGHWALSTVKYYAGGWVSNSDNAEESDTNWRLYAATGDTVADNWGFYVNSNLKIQNSNGVEGPDGFALGSNRGLSEFSNSHVSFLMAYNRVLSADEIKQNFSALRGRYGI